ncbi:hypothetical protein [Azohydromonas aeria]|uniref:hypothetical protein n=1 Tax=Azohydromonas aeria TaxID=2590212 RepID=UPI0012FB4807|nr:hypothetical protein [Azohydromonas aeria]
MAQRKPRFNPIARNLSASLPAVDVVWYTREEWGKVKASAVDAEVFEATYDEWLAMAEEAVQEWKIAGLNIEKVLVKADEFAAWCIVHGKPNNGASRSEFVVQQSQKRASPQA